MKNIRLPAPEPENARRVHKALEADGWIITAVRTGSMRGADIEAVKGRLFLLCEVAGGTSSTPGSARYGSPFTKRQVEVTVSRLTFQCLTHRAKHDPANTRVVMAVPDNADYREVVDRVLGMLGQVDIKVLFVGDDGLVPAVAA